MLTVPKLADFADNTQVPQEAHTQSAECTKQSDASWVSDAVVHWTHPSPSLGLLDVEACQQLQVFDLPSAERADLATSKTTSTTTSTWLPAHATLLPQV